MPFLLVKHHRSLVLLLHPSWRGVLITQKMRSSINGSSKDLRIDRCEFIFSRGRYSTKVSDLLFSLERTDAVYWVAVLLFVLDHAELFNFK